MIMIFEFTTEVYNLFMVSLSASLCCLYSVTQIVELKLLFSFCQSLVKRFDAKSKFLRKFIPLVQPTHEFARERDAIVKRANDAEANAQWSMEAELSLL